MDARTADSVVRLDRLADDELHHAYKYQWLSARGRHRVLRVAQTIADLGGRERVGRDDVLLALSLRQRTATDLEAAA
jgi:predicted ATPase with chaperone activity